MSSLLVPVPFPSDDAPGTSRNIYSLLVQSHNTPLLFPKIWHNHCLQVLLEHEDFLSREIKNNAYANFWVVKEVYYGICASSEFEIIGIKMAAVSAKIVVNTNCHPSN